jgi:RNA polymerase sigma-70 factor (ECF subfamily)
MLITGNYTPAMLQFPNMLQDQLDQRLLARLKKGDAKAVHQWFTSYHPRVKKLVMSKVSSEADAQEIAQDTFTSCLKHLPLFRGESSIWTWMSRIARHEIADYYRKRYAKKALKTLPLLEMVLHDAPPANAHDTSLKVKAALRQLPADHQELLLLKYVDRKKVRQIASELDRTVKAVESDLFRARQAFRAAYD